MKRIRFVFGIWLLIVIMIGIAIFYGRANSVPNRLQELGFGVCDGKPCFMGVSAGMSWGEAEAILAQDKRIFQVKNTDSPMIVSINKENDLEVVLRDDANKGIVEEIEFGYFWNEITFRPYLWNLITLYGNPCAVKIILIDGNLERLLIEYPQLSLELSLRVDHLGFMSEVERLTISNNVPGRINVCEDEAPNDQVIVNSWRGFKKRDYYMIERHITP